MIRHPTGVAHGLEPRVEDDAGTAIEWYSLDIATDASIDGVKVAENPPLTVAKEAMIDGRGFTYTAIHYRQSLTSGDIDCN